MSDRLPTRERILQAAIDVFTRQGYAATTTRDIAAAAGVNIATLHYHHRSKEELFASVSAGAMEEFNAAFDRSLAESSDLYTFLVQYVEQYTELILLHPYLVGFVMSESERAPEDFDAKVNFPEWSAQIAILLQAEAEKRQMPVPDTSNFVCDLVGMLTFPFLMRHSMSHSMGVSAEEFSTFARNRATHIPQTLMARFER